MPPHKNSLGRKHSISFVKYLLYTSKNNPIKKEIKKLRYLFFLLNFKIKKGSDKKKRSIMISFLL